MTLDELEAFVSIAASGGFTQASRRLHRSQPAISRRIRQLELGLDAALFERVGRSVRLSDAGEALLPHAEAALAAMRDAERAVRARSGPSGDSLALRVAIVGSLADSQLVVALRAFQKRFGAASIELRTASSVEVSALVRRGEADLGMRYQTDPDRRLESIPLGSERLFLVLPSDHRVRARRLRDLRPFAGDKFFAFPADPRSPESSRLVQARLIVAGLAPEAITPIDSLTAQKRLVEAGLGIALLPRSSFREEQVRGTIRTVEVDGLRFEQPVVVVRRRGSFESPAAAAFLALLRRTTPASLSGRLTRKKG